MLQNVIKNLKNTFNTLKIDQNLGWKNLGLEPGFGRGGVAAPPKCNVNSNPDEHRPKGMTVTCLCSFFVFPEFPRDVGGGWMHPNEN